VTGGNNEEKSGEKPPSTKQKLEALQILCKEIQQKDDFDVFKQHNLHTNSIIILFVDYSIIIL
jgi:hypothetical protein